MSFLRPGVMKQCTTPHIYQKVTKCVDVGLNIFYFIYMKRDWAEHRCYGDALSHTFTIVRTCIDIQS